MKNLSVLTWIVLCTILFSTLSFSAQSTANENISKNELNTQSSSGQTAQNATSIKQPSKEMLAAMSRVKSGNANADDGLSNYQRIEKYLKSGFVHILPLGLDHILFVLALFFSTTRLQKLFWQITAFTLAHSVTLVLSSSGYITLSGSIVEPLIALSIAWMAVDNIHNEHTNNMRLWVIVFFGLLHGLGFASVLSEFGLPQEAFLVALFSFNVGVELGQLAVLIMATALFYYWSRKPSYRMFVQLPVSVLIAVTGLFWFFERIL